MHMSPGAVNLFKAKTFKINGSYVYFSEVREENIETLKLNFDVCEIFIVLPSRSDLCYR